MVWELYVAVSQLHENETKNLGGVFGGEEKKK